jgi:glutaminase
MWPQMSTGHSNLRCVIGGTGNIYAVGDLDYEFTIISVSTRFVFTRAAGLYETSGAWLNDIGLRGESGFGGDFVAISPGNGGLGTFSPPLAQVSNSVKGQPAEKSHS